MKKNCPFPLGPLCANGERQTANVTAHNFFIECVRECVVRRTYARRVSTHSLDFREIFQMERIQSTIPMHDDDDDGGDSGDGDKRPKPNRVTLSA